MTTATANTLLTGIPVGRFEVVREIGRGGIAVVYLARQAGLDREVALKELSAAHAHDPAFADRFLREARIAGSLNHPNIVSVLDYFELDGVPYIAMEYLPGGSLRRRAQTLRMAQIVGVMDGLLSALSHAGASGVVHRDIKPENLLFSGDGVVKVADFGVAKALHIASDHYATVTGMTVGTPAYMAPEQAVGKNVGAPADVYAAGVIAYELATGQTPFADAETPVAMLYRHVHDDPTPPTALRPELHPRLEEWVLALMAKRPEDRPTADDARAELDAFAIDELGLEWRAGATVPPQPPAGDGVAAGPRLSESVSTFQALDSLSEDDGFRTFTPRARARFGPQGLANGHARARSTPALAPTEDPVAVVASVVSTNVPTSPALRATTAASATADDTTRIPRARGRRRLLIGAGMLGLAGAATAVAIALTAGPDAPKVAPSAVADRLPAIVPGVAVTGGTAVIADPSGRLVRLGLANLATQAAVRDPLLPRSVAVDGANVLVGDAEGVTLRNARTLAPVWATATGAPTMVAATSAGPVVAYADGSGGGRLCAVGPQGGLTGCTALGFSPTGLGAVGSTAVVADGTGGQVVLLEVGASTLSRTQSIVVGRRPAGRVVTDTSGRAYVPIERGVAAVDVQSRQLVAAIRLPTTPSDLAATTGVERVAATLPGAGSVAIIDTSRFDSPPRQVATGDEPVAVAASTDGFLVLGAGGSVSLVDAQSGDLARKAPLKAAPGTAARATLSRVRAVRAARTVRLTFTFDQPLDVQSVSKTRGRIAAGAASFDVWQGGINSTVRRASKAGVKVVVAQRSGRLIVRVSASRKRFESMAVVRAADGRSVVVTLTLPPAPGPPVPPPTPPTGGGDQGGPGPGPTPGPTPGPNPGPPVVPE